MSASEDLSAWLERHRLTTCAATLRENDIGLDVLPGLGDADLAGLGLAADVRQRLLKAATALRVVRSSGRRGRLDTVAGKKPTPLVGREDELDQIVGRWNRARLGHGQLVLVTAEAGLGKSRLAEEFRIRVADTPHIWIETGCGQLLQNTSFHPFIAYFADRFGDRDQSPERRLHALEDSLAAAGIAADEAVPLLAPMLDLALPDRYVPSTAPAEDRRRRLVSLIAAWFLETSRLQPMVLVFEDLNWADPSTLDVLKVMADQAAAVPILLLLTARPEFRAPWPSRLHHTAITLGPLGTSDATRIVAGISADRGLTDDVIEILVARTRGVPLFVEEAARLLLETGREADAQVPSTLEAALAARLDRLGPAREVAQLAAVVGGAFSHRLIRAVAGLDEPTLAPALQRLIEADILQPQGTEPRIFYRFRHSLARDIAYESLQLSRRRELHRTLADVLSGQFKDLIATRPELLAHHLTEAGDTVTALDIWSRAGQEAMARAAFAEGGAHYERAIEILEALPDADQRLKEQFQLRTKRAECLVVSKGHSAPETRKAFEDALNLGERVGDPIMLATVLSGLVSAAAQRAEYAAAQAYADRLLSLAQRSGGTFERGWAHFRQGHIHFYQGDLRAARRALETAWSIGATEPLTIGGTRLSGAITVLLPLVVTLMGEIDKGVRLGDESVIREEQARLPHSVAYAKVGAIAPRLVAGDPAATEALARPLLTLCIEHKLLVFQAFASIYLGWALGGLGQGAEGVEHARHGMATLNAVGTKGLSNWYLTLLAETEFEAGEQDQAMATVDKAVQMDAVSPFGTSHALRVKGELLLRRARSLTGDAAVRAIAGGEQALRSAMATARRQGALLVELRAATLLAGQFADRGDAAGARALLAPLYGRFVEGLDTRCLREAKAVLDKV